MPIALTCSVCARKLKVRDEAAGKSVQCPACGTVLRVPGATAAAVPPPTSPPASQAAAGSGPPSASPAAPAAQPRKRRKRRRRGPVLPRVNLFGIDLTLTRLLVAVVVLGAAGFGLLWWLSRPGPRPEARRVDVYAALTGIRQSVFRQPTLLITRDDPQGEFLLVKFKVPKKQFDKRFADAKGPVLLPAQEIQLQGPDKAVTPLFLVSQVDSGSGYQLTYPGGEVFAWERSGDGKTEIVKKPPDLYECLGPRPGSPWQSRGELEIHKPGTSHFRGEHGLTVDFQHHLDLKEIGSAPPEERAEIRKELDALNQQVQVTWDAASSGWLAAEAVEEPAEPFLFGWELTCVFPLPATSGKLTLSVLGQPMPLDVPGK
jgi:hypothetical protein